MTDYRSWRPNLFGRNPPGTYMMQAAHGEFITLTFKI
jgi:hypothetical protein